jgi:hypothetical protein
MTLSQTLTEALNWIVANKTVIIADALIALPSIITALSNYPKAAGLESALKTVLNLLSVLSHADSPGTMKFPGTMSKAPEGQPKTLGTGGGTGAAALIVMSMFMGGCTFFKSIAKPS